MAKEKKKKIRVSQQSSLAKKLKTKSQNQDIAKFKVIKVLAYPLSKKECVFVRDNGVYEVWVRDKAKSNLANNKVKLLLADYFGLALNKVVLIKGSTSPHKNFAIYQ